MVRDRLSAHAPLFFNDEVIGELLMNLYTCKKCTAARILSAKHDFDALRNELDDLVSSLNDLVKELVALWAMANSPCCSCQSL